MQGDWQGMNPVSLAYFTKQLIAYIHTQHVPIKLLK
jgi:hypothetical protein